MVEARLNDGTPLTNISNDAQWPVFYTDPAYCWFEFETKNKDLYGALYNGRAVLTQKLAPKGWRVPTIEDIGKLIKQVDPEASLTAGFPSSLAYQFPPREWIRATQVTGARLKAKGIAHWEGTDESGFSALPASFRQTSAWGDIILGDAPFPDFYRMNAVFWTSTQFSFPGHISVLNNRLYRLLISGEANMFNDLVHSSEGNSVRCLMSN